MSTSARERFKDYTTDQLFRLIERLEGQRSALKNDLDRKEGIPALGKIIRLQDELDRAYTVIYKYQDWHRQHEYTVTSGPSLSQRTYDGNNNFIPK